MRSAIIRLARSAALGTAALGVVLTGTAVAHADEWPVIPSEPSYSTPVEYKNFLTPSDPDYWNPLVNKNRLTSPYGTRTKIVCTALPYGVLSECWQADLACNAHKLIKLPWNVPAIVGGGQPGGGPGHFVYPVGTATHVDGPIHGGAPAGPPAGGGGENRVTCP
jgi:hypothetical protein